MQKNTQPRLSWYVGCKKAALRPINSNLSNLFKLDAQDARGTELRTNTYVTFSCGLRLTYTQVLTDQQNLAHISCVDNGYCLEDLPRVMAH